MKADFACFRYEHDGLGLHGRIYGDLAETASPLVCLSGLTRNSRDFHEFALTIRRGLAPRPVVTFDYRGRGLSDRASEASAYTLTAEMGDIVAGLEHLGIGRAIFVGTSRGALLIHLLGLAHGDLIAGAVLNDAGPRLEVEGLLAIKSYVGKAGVLPDWRAAIDIVTRINRETFPALGGEDFERMARANFVERPNGVVADYDTRLADALAGIDASNPLPEMWEAFAALRAVPVLVLRGEHSMLLSRDTVARMRAAHPDLAAIEVAGQGHAPLLETTGLPERIAAFAARTD